MSGYASLTPREQVLALHPIVREALPLYGIEGAQFRLVNHGFNTTFRIQTPDRKYALRINIGSARRIEEIRGEVAWIEALARETEVLVPAPVRSLDGEGVVEIPNWHFESPRRVVLYDWLDGRHFSNRIGRKGGLLIGRLMGRLHDHGQRFRFPRGASRPKMLDILDSVPWRLPERGVMREVRDRAQSVMDKFAHVPRQVVHFDVHLGNLKVHRDEVSVFDFDDCLMAWPGLDIAQSMFYLRRSIHAEELEVGLWEGLGRPLESYGLDREEFEALVAGRALLLACDLVGNKNAELQRLAPKYLANTEVRIANYLETGRFDSRLTAPG